MKTIISTMVATIAITLTAAAAASSSLRIDTTIADGDRIVSKPSLFVLSGKQGWIRSGGKESVLTYAVTPTLLDNGKVDIRTVVTYRKGKTTNKLARHIVVPLGTVARVRNGELSYTVKPTLDKLPRRQ